MGTGALRPAAEPHLWGWVLAFPAGSLRRGPGCCTGHFCWPGPHPTPTSLSRGPWGCASLLPLGHFLLPSELDRAAPREVCPAVSLLHLFSLPLFLLLVYKLVFSLLFSHVSGRRDDKMESCVRVCLVCAHVCELSAAHVPSRGCLAGPYLPSCPYCGVTGLRLWSLRFSVFAQLLARLHISAVSHVPFSLWMRPLSPATLLGHDCVSPCFCWVLSPIHLEPSCCPGAGRGCQLDTHPFSPGVCPLCLPLPLSLREAPPILRQCAASSPGSQCLWVRFFSLVSLFVPMTM